MKNWLSSIFRYDPRRGSRKQEPPVEAFFWNGGKPAAHAVQNISPNGFYMVTDERWLEGTFIVMTLQRTLNYSNGNHHSLVVLSKVVHIGDDGVGFQFVPVEQATPSQLPPEGSNAADRKALDAFLHQLTRDMN